ncbi:MAG: DUF1513 domain-containing protein, partial [Burkholderiales bacterium]|nr:DUF1513 domain-containing protein [Burkholderiales bacterium]
RAFNGHVIAAAGGRVLYTTETDLESGEGLVGVRDARTLGKLAEWPTRGKDPHELLLDAAGCLVVANGGIATLPETGRAKHDLERMDSSLVRLAPDGGRLLGQWRLHDPRLSLRHLAWNGTLLGIALQAEHDDPAAKAAAPVLALFDGRTLRSVSAARPLAGYGGSIAATAGTFAVSCPRAGGVALWRNDGRWSGFVPLEEACPLAAAWQVLWAGGLNRAVAVRAGNHDAAAGPHPLRLDNHWTVLPRHHMAS